MLSNVGGLNRVAVGCRVAEVFGHLDFDNSQDYSNFPSCALPSLFPGLDDIL